jgi:hypothetical protein
MKTLLKRLISLSRIVFDIFCLICGGICGLGIVAGVWAMLEGEINGVLMILSFAAATLVCIGLMKCSFGGRWKPIFTEL